MVELSKYNNSGFRPGNKLIILIWYFFNVFFFQNPINFSSSLKTNILRLFGAKVGKGVVIKPNVNIKYPWMLKIGNHSWIGERVWIDNLANVTIGNNVCISQDALLLCGNHDYTKSSFDLRVKEINIKEGAWVGARSTVCPGVTLNSFSILTVGSTANKNLESCYIYQGNPAVKLRERKFQ